MVFHLENINQALSVVSFEKSFKLPLLPLFTTNYASVMTTHISVISTVDTLWPNEHIFEHLLSQNIYL